MPAFKDGTGHEWTININVGSIAKVKKDVGLNLAIASKEAAWLEVIYNDMAKLAQILWVLCEKQAKEANVTPEEFAERLTGEVLGAAGEALVVGVCDFFPRSKVSQAIKAKMQS